MILQETIQAVMAYWITTNPDVPIYLNHAPQKVKYPFVVVNFISSPRTYAMGGSGHTKPYQYTKQRMSFSAYNNEDGFTSVMTLANTIESTYNLKALTLNNGVTGIFNWMSDQKVVFEDENKVWNVTTDFIFMVGE